MGQGLYFYRGHRFFLCCAFCWLCLVISCPVYASVSLPLSHVCVCMCVMASVLRLRGVVCDSFLLRTFVCECAAGLSSRLCVRKRLDCAAISHDSGWAEVDASTLTAASSPSAPRASRVHRTQVRAGVGFAVLSFGFRVSGFKFRVQGSGFRVLG